MEQKAWEGCQALCARDPTPQDSTNCLVRRWVGDKDIGQKRNHIEVELRHLILVENLVAHHAVCGHSWVHNGVRVWAVVLGHALAIDQARHEAAKKHKHQGVQEQTQVAGDATAVGDPRAEQAAGQLEGLGVGDEEKHDKGNDVHFHVTVHFVILVENLISKSLPVLPSRVHVESGVVERLCGFLEGGFIVFENWVVERLFLRHIFTNLGVNLCDRHTDRVECNCWSISELVPGRNLKRNQNLVHRLFLGRC